MAHALFEVLEENQWEVEYIRNAKEPIGPFLKMNSLYSSYQAINFVKNILLNFCSVLLERKLKIRKVAPMYLWGLVMSGHMDEERRKLLPSMVKRQKEGKNILGNPASSGARIGGRNFRRIQSERCNLISCFKR